MKRLLESGAAAALSTLPAVPALARNVEVMPFGRIAIALALARNPKIVAGNERPLHISLSGVTMDFTAAVACVAAC